MHDVKHIEEPFHRSSLFTVIHEHDNARIKITKNDAGKITRNGETVGGADIFLDH